MRLLYRALKYFLTGVDEKDSCHARTVEACTTIADTGHNNQSAIMQFFNYSSRAVTLALGRRLPGSHPALSQ
jgi:hypothetical protein